MLLELHFERFTRRCAEVSGRTEEELRARYVEGEIKRGFETGRTSEREFFAELRDWLNWPAERMKELKFFWADIFEAMPGAREALAQFRKQGRVWILSDTDPAHIEFIRGRFPWALEAARVLTSYERGVSKREPGAFEGIVALAGCAPEELLFIDDTQANVDAAQAAGIDARLFDNWKTFSQRLLTDN